MVEAEECLNYYRIWRIKEKCFTVIWWISASNILLFAEANSVGPWMLRSRRRGRASELLQKWFICRQEKEEDAIGLFSCLAWVMRLQEVCLKGPTMTTVQWPPTIVAIFNDPFVPIGVGKWIIELWWVKWQWIIDIFWRTNYSRIKTKITVFKCHYYDS